MARKKSMQLNGKMQAYAAARAQGLRPLDAAAHAGYSGSGIKVTTSRIEARSDVQAEIRRLKRGGEGANVEVEENDNGRDQWAMKDHYSSPLELMKDVMNNPKAPKSLRYQAAKDALPYCHARMEGGKKQDKEEAAKKAGKGKFGVGQRPSYQRQVN